MPKFRVTAFLGEVSWDCIEAADEEAAIDEAMDQLASWGEKLDDVMELGSWEAKPVTEEEEPNCEG